MAKFNDTLRDFLNSHSQSKMFLKKEHSFYNQLQNIWNKQFFLSSGRATLTYKYETRIIITSNLYHCRKEVAMPWTGGVFGQGRKSGNSGKLFFWPCYLLMSQWSILRPPHFLYLSTTRQRLFTLNLESSFLVEYLFYS